MGVYCASFVYHGRLLTNSTHEAFLALDEGLRQGCAVTRVADKFALHVPGRGFWTGNFDPLLEQHELHRGWVQGSDLDAVIDRREDKRRAWDAATPQQVAHVDSVVRMLGNQKLADTSGIAVYVCEVETHSLGGAHAAGRLMNNIIVKGTP